MAQILPDACFPAPAPRAALPATMVSPNRKDAMHAGSFGLLVQTQPADTVAGAVPHPSRHREAHLFHRTRERWVAGARSTVTGITAVFVTLGSRIYRK